MSVIAGTTKESVINKAREVLREKEIPYTIKRTKTWFWVSSTKPGAAQTALREAGLEMNPIITMHSIWCTKCGAIRTFKKRADDWICQKCGARLLMFKNPTKVKAMVHPEALESLARYKDDLKAGHKDAAEYWRGQAGAYFTANPRGTPGVKKIKGVYYFQMTKPVLKHMAKEIAERMREEEGLKVYVHPVPGAKGYYAVYGANPSINPKFLKKTAEQRRAGYALSKELGLEPAMARRTRDWRSPKVYRMLGLPVPPLSERRAMGLVNPQREGRLTILTRRGRQPWTFKNMPELIKEATKKFKPKSRYEQLSMEKSIESALRDWRSDQGKVISLRWYKNPLTAQEKREITNLANTQFAISRKYSDDPVRSSFWYGRSVGMGKIAKMYNPKVKKWDPISEAIEEEEEEDEMIGAEINPLSQFCCSVCETCAPKRLLPHSKFPERMRWLRHHYMRKHPGLWPWRGNPLSRELEYELEQFIRKPKLPKIEERIRLAKKFLRERGEPTDMPRVLIATKSLEDLYKSEHKNPLTAIGSAAITGVGLGIGFKSVDWMVKKIKKNPRRR